MCIAKRLPARQAAAKPPWTRNAGWIVKHKRTGSLKTQARAQHPARLAFQAAIVCLICAAFIGFAYRVRIPKGSLKTSLH